MTRRLADAKEREEFHRCIECDGEDPYDILALKPQQRHRLLLGDGPEKGHENYRRRARRSTPEGR